QEAGYAVAREGAGLQPGSRIILGSDASAALQAGTACTVPLTPNSSATLIREDERLCVRVTTPQTSAALDQTLVSPETTYGQQSGAERRRGFGFPEGFFGLALATSILAAIFEDDDRPPPAPPVSQ